MKTIDEYAIDLVVRGAQSVAEDDLNEDGEIAEENHQAACDLALRVAQAIAANPKAVFALVAVEQLSLVSEAVEAAVATMDRLRTEHERKGLYPGALAYQGAAELVKQALRGGENED